MKQFPEYGRKRVPKLSAAAAAEHLRNQIVGRLHAGWLKLGDRLPSIRDVAQRIGVDHRVAGRALRQLEQEGLVEIRTKSGVFVATPRSAADDEDERVACAAAVMLHAWESRVPRSALCQMLGAQFRSSLRCACVESNRDSMIALGAEIEFGLSVQVDPFYLDPAERAPDASLAGADFLVTSIFHAAEARELAAEAGRPLVVLTLRREFAAEIARRLGEGPVTAVVLDPRYAERGRRFFAASGHADSLRFVLADRAEREGVDLADERVLISLGARRRLGLEEFHLIRSPSLVSVEAARELCGVVARLEVEKRSSVVGHRSSVDG